MQYFATGGFAIEVQRKANKIKVSYFRLAPSHRRVFERSHLASINESTTLVYVFSRPPPMRRVVTGVARHPS